jgi:hypothetical protein
MNEANELSDCAGQTVFIILDQNTQLADFWINFLSIMNTQVHATIQNKSNI